jgi:DNA-binding response OmpR family regulator
MKLLLVEDELPLSDALRQILSRQKYEVRTVADGNAAMDEALSGIYDIVLLDVMLPGCSGLQIVKAMREAGLSTPVLLLTAKSEIEDRVKGLDCGADDYLAKPFATEELLARLRALSRRKGEIITDNSLSFGDLSLDISCYELCCGEQRVRLSCKEMDIVKYLLLRGHMVVAKEELLTKLWGYDAQAENNNLEVYISFIRKKLAYLGTKVRIGTIRGVGYQLEEAEE